MSLQNKSRLLLLMVICFSSCKEDPCEPKALNHKLSFLEGKWKWEYSEQIKKIPYSNNYNTDTIKAETFSDDYIITVHEQGVLECFKGNIRVKTFNSCDVDFYDKSCFTNDGVQFNLYEEGIDGHSITGCGSSNSNIMKAYTSKFIPLEDKKDTLYEHYFIKME